MQNFESFKTGLTGSLSQFQQIGDVHLLVTVFLPSIISFGHLPLSIQLNYMQLKDMKLDTL